MLVDTGAEGSGLPVFPKFWRKDVYSRLLNIHRIMKQQPNYNQKLARLLRIVRLISNYTQAYVARKLFISNAAYILIESGHTTLTTRRLEAVAQLYNIPIEDLVSCSATRIITQLLREQGMDEVNYCEERIAALEKDNQRLLKLLEISLQTASIE